MGTLDESRQMDYKRLLATLTRDEGKRNEVYKDSVGIDTIGVGHNLETGELPPEMRTELATTGELSDASVNRLLRDDVEVALKEVSAMFSECWDDLSGLRKEVLVNMMFNMGYGTLAKFRNMIAAVHEGDYLRAGDEMLDSRWARQVGNRSRRLVQAMRTDDPAALKV